VVEVDVGEGVAPAELLATAKSIERDMGRVAGGPRWGPRPIDIDLLFLGNTIVGGTEERDASLVVPHPRIADRHFVLQPLADLAPSFVHPVLKRSVSDLLGACADAPLLGGPWTLPRTVGVRVLPYGGDLALRVRGASPADLVRRGCHGLVSAIVSRDRLREEDRREAAFELPASADRLPRSGFAELFVDVLNELLVWLDADAWLPARVAVRFEDRRVVVAAFGAAIRGRELPIERSPKAVTRHELRVVRRAGGWSAHVVVDL
jgi:SHS2 domain-containing protein